MMSTSVSNPTSALQPEQADHETPDDVSFDTSTPKSDENRCGHNQLSIPGLIPSNAPTPDENNAENVSLASLSTPSLALAVSLPSPMSVVGGIFPDGIAHEIPLPPSVTSSISGKTFSSSTAREIPLPPSASSSASGERFSLEAANDIPLPPSEGISTSPGSTSLETLSFTRTDQISLPSSASRSTNATHSVYTISETTHLPPGLIGSERDTSNEFDIENIWDGSHRRGARHLQTRIDQISEWLPHLRVLFPEFGTKRVAPARVKSYQISEAVSTFRVLDEFKVVSSADWFLVRDCLSRKPLSLETERIVLVEDLNPRLITGLYGAFGVGPEVFAEHLNRSGYGSSSYSDPDPSTWNFRSPKKNYASIKWYRPVYKADVVEMPTHARLKFRDSNEAEWKEQKTVELESDERKSATLTHRLTRCTNILRQERPLSSVISDPWEAGKKRTLATIEERVTLYTDERQGHRIALAFVDPLPYINYSRETQTGIESEALYEEEDKLPAPVHPRSPPPVSSVDELLRNRNFIRSKTYFETHTSMLQDVEAWMTEYAHQSLPEHANHLFVAILEIVSRDTRTTLSLLTAALSEISLGSMDDSQEQERLASWQMLIRSYQADLPLMKDSLHEFVRWCFSDDIPPDVRRKVDELANRTDDLITRVEKAHQALRAELSILESKRGIAEAEGVAKLTELAFIFIPLTFSASLFSMQVRELEEDMPTLAGFVGVCISLLFLSYGVRLAVRSHVVIDRKRELFRKIKVDSALDSKDIPTRVFVLWVFKKLTLGLFQERELGRLTVGLLFISAIFIPALALIWTKTSLDTGLKAMLTVLLIGGALMIWLYLSVRRLGSLFKKRVALRYSITFGARGRRNEAEGSVEAV